ncbi:Class F sortase OS=Streptomyces tendae OX=1932 GN=F3L20_25835 PE=4 SV=1 [Streptomyces tendae]
MNLPFFVYGTLRHSLGALRKGSTIEVDRHDGTVAVFTVDAVEAYDARDFPDAKVYGAAARPELRVITCGAGYSPTTGYRGNVVVYAHLAGTR